MAIEHAEGESQRRIFHGHNNGARDLGDYWSPAIAHETGHQTEVGGNVSKLILPVKFCCTAFFIIHMEQRNGARTE
jgi:hypothetical protein